MTRINKSGFFIRIIRGFGPVLGLLAVSGVFSLIVDTPSRLLSPNNLRIVLSQTVIVAIGAIGMTLIIISGGIDLAVGSTIALTGVVTALAINAGFACGSSAAGFIMMLSVFWLFAGDALTTATFGLIAWFLLPRGVTASAKEATWAEAWRVLRRDHAFWALFAATVLSSDSLAAKSAK